MNSSEFTDSGRVASSQSRSVWDAPESVFRVWRMRDRVELEAADLFDRLAFHTRAVWGEGDKVAALSEQAAMDERRHSVLCRMILAQSPTRIEPLQPQLGMSLGPPHLNISQRVVYTAVAIGCVTETLSTALLIEMQKRAVPRLIRSTIHEILEDEVLHSRIGWAELSRAAQLSDVSWLGPWVSGMIREALATDVEPMLGSEKETVELSPWGILPRSEAKDIMNVTIREVVLPGLKQYGLLPTKTSFLSSLESLREVLRRSIPFFEVRLTITTLFLEMALKESFHT